jgi:hypothetical protein
MPEQQLGSVCDNTQIKGGSVSKERPMRQRKKREGERVCGTGKRNCDGGAYGITSWHGSATIDTFLQLYRYPTHTHSTHKGARPCAATGVFPPCFPYHCGASPSSSSSFLCSSLTAGISIRYYVSTSGSSRSVREDRGNRTLRGRSERTSDCELESEESPKKVRRRMS